MAIQIDLAKCTGCACCLDACDFGALELQPSPQFERPSCDEDTCTECAECVDLCPTAALCLPEG